MRGGQGGGSAVAGLLIQGSVSYPGRMAFWSLEFNVFNFKGDAAFKAGIAGWGTSSNRDLDLLPDYA